MRRQLVALVAVVVLAAASGDDWLPVLDDAARDFGTPGED